MIYAVRVPSQPAFLVRGSSRRITIVRYRPANIRVINRRINSGWCHPLHCRQPVYPEKLKPGGSRSLTGSLHIRSSKMRFKPLAAGYARR